MAGLEIREPWEYTLLYSSLFGGPRLSSLECSVWAKLIEAVHAGSCAGHGGGDKIIALLEKC